MTCPRPPSELLTNPCDGSQNVPACTEKLRQCKRSEQWWHIGMSQSSTNGILGGVCPHFRAAVSATGRSRHKVHTQGDERLQCVRPTVLTKLCPEPPPSKESMPAQNKQPENLVSTVTFISGDVESKMILRAVRVHLSSVAAAQMVSRESRPPSARRSSSVGATQLICTRESLSNSLSAKAFSDATRYEIIAS